MGEGKIQVIVLTDFRPAEVRASNDIHGSTIAGYGKIEDDNEPPVLDETWNAVDQTSEQGQE